MLKWLAVIFFSVQFICSGLGQCPDLPEKFIMETPEDYAKYEEMSFSMMDCLVNHPQDLSQEEKEVGEAFSLIWLGGTPNWVVDVDMDIIKFTDELPELLYTYIFSYALVQKEYTNFTQEEIEVEALNMVAQHYFNGNYAEKSRFLSKIAKKYKSGKLGKYVQSLKK